MVDGKRTLEASELRERLSEEVPPFSLYSMDQEETLER